VISIFLPLADIRRWQSYVEPGDEGDEHGSSSQQSSPAKRSISRNLEQLEGEEFPPLPEGTLARNLGLDLVVVLTKTDYMAELERDFDYKEEHFDFVQQSVRKFCLK